ncbi:MAG: amidohydrolase family protein [Nocardioidaceae bacterium]
MRTILKADRLLVDARADLLLDAAICVEDGTIVQVGTAAEVRPLERDAEVRELGDVTVMPGMFDCHVHLSFDGEKADIHEVSTDARVAVVMASNALRLLDAGVTSARDLGSPGTVAVEVRDAIAGGLLAGPRLQVANAPITVTGGHAWALGGEADGVVDVVRQVRRHSRDGADLIKIMTTGGFMTAGSRPWEARFSQDELSAAVEEAHRLGMRVTTHALGVEGIARAVTAGVDSIEHCAWVARDGLAFDAEVAARIAAEGIRVCTTMNTACLPDPYFCPWGSRADLLDNLGRMLDAGIQFIAGTDSGIPLVPFERYADGLRVLAEAGMSPRAVVEAATTAAATACGVSHLTGRLEAGLAADVIAVTGDPTTDVDALAHPVYVMANGVSHPPRRSASATPEENRVRAEELLDLLTVGSGRLEPVE